MLNPRIVSKSRAKKRALQRRERRGRNVDRDAVCIDTRRGRRRFGKLFRQKRPEGMGREKEKPAKEFELIPKEGGYRKVLAFAKSLGGTVRFVYEAGPCGYDLYRRLNKAGYRCDVAAPSLTPNKPGQRVKTNRRMR